ncbi:MAG: ABC transporter [Piscirickettsiaceae bacterium CG_4_9_14_3_um_filter_43_564]|nr:ABC transporter ATP-binding protein [Thiomicrospira sp.]OIP95050.1 MAG: ABC transporter [Thiomicrospira sp. CG2_30_44_34]PIQ04119.1 MAG: ABC transporter [Piscirickettsiaceae bacterium CG18_big_fil_WC_8_21_14_2_50_44_103]PIW58693.1 MAG: ABC transporter [Piscirickettsiaceae bacterium CG12_big_fil_rev_8_21_14_0_65_44_934]PIX80348.1 MAG: ABC transporter [Piscirickettsiaceae bacterium CG_4_10_14_3_um_filter_44_349]PIY77359.1 MAG: ABC transporter [Piscirickettsiaceae bacterium CG_4_10_14_0_8_um_f
MIHDVPVLSLNNVHYRIASDEETLSIIKGCDLTVQSGETLAIVGRSGSGKSTLLSLMAGLERPTSGDIQLLGQSLKSLNEDARAQIRAKAVGFVFQNFQLMPSMTAMENVLMPLELFQFPNALEAATEALHKVGLSHRLNHCPAELSGGEQQRVALARAFVTEPKILFADEPTGNLDETTAQQVQELLFELNEATQTTLILVTHDSQLAQQCDRTLTLQHGRLNALDMATEHRLS